jgi:GNAT superfamily N-acetyltransferase
MEDVSYRHATTADVKILVEMRAAFLAETTGANAADPALLAALDRYFSRAIPSAEFVAFLGVAADRAIATSGMVYRRQPPSAKNLEGLEAYVLNMYVLPPWRGRGIASALLEKLIATARQANCRRVSLHTFPNAAPIYARAGFVSAPDLMQLELR